MDAKHFIPGFVSSTLEFFADQHYKEADTDGTAIENEGKGVESKDTVYKNFASKIFEILIESTFDGYLFGELSGNDTEGQLGDLIYNIEIEGSQTNFGKKTVVSKLLSLFSYMISARFAQSWGSLFRIFDQFLKKICSLGHRSSALYNNWLAGVYRDTHSIITLMPEFESQLEGLLSSIINNSDSVMFFDELFGAHSHDLAQLLDNDQFRYYIYLVSVHGRGLAFKLLYVKLRPIFEMALNELAVSKGNMEIEEDGAAQMDPNAIGNRLRHSLFTQIINASSKFTEFNSLEIGLLPESLKFLLQAMDVNPSSAHQTVKALVKLIIHLIMTVINESNKKMSKVMSEIVEILKTNTVLAKTSKAFIGAASAEDVQLYDNYLKVLGKILPAQHTIGIISKNIKRLRVLLQKKDQESMERAVREAAIVSALLTAFDDLFRQVEVFNDALGFGQELLECGVKGAAKAAFKIYTSILRNSHPSQYPEILTIVQERVNLFLEGKIKDHKFDLFALKFLKNGLESIALNFDKKFLAENLHKFMEKFLSFIVFNIRNKGAKARDSSKSLISLITVLYHDIDPNEVPELQSSRIINADFAQVISKAGSFQKIDEESFVVSCLIAGLAGDSGYMKSCTIEALAYLFKSLGEYCSQSLIKSSTEVVLLLIKEKNREVFTSILKFLKAVFKKQNRAVLAEDLPLIAEAVFEWDSSNTKAIRNKVKTLISVIIRKFVE